jgi:L-lactate dehydrogenase complex protein LldG
MSDARNNILQRLRRHAVSPQAVSDITISMPNWNIEEKIARFTERITAVHGEVIRLDDKSVINWLNLELPARRLDHVLLGVGALADKLAAGLTAVSVSRYDQPVEGIKQQLFSDIDAAITGCRAAIAETGSLVLWPDADEPRLMSLVPPVHIVLLDAQTLYNSFEEIVSDQQWQLGMPTNALLISGPSKTADIEQTLAYGIHGPKQLIVLIT